MKLAEGYDKFDVLITVSMFIVSMIMILYGDYIAGSIYILVAVVWEGFATIRVRIDRLSAEGVDVDAE